MATKRKAVVAGPPERPHVYVVVSSRGKYAKQYPPGTVMFESAHQQGKTRTWQVVDVKAPDKTAFSMLAVYLGVWRGDDRELLVKALRALQSKPRQRRKGAK